MQTKKQHVEEIKNDRTSLSACLMLHACHHPRRSPSCSTRPTDRPTDRPTVIGNCLLLHSFFRLHSDALADWLADRDDRTKCCCQREWTDGVLRSKVFVYTDISPFHSVLQGLNQERAAASFLRAVWTSGQQAHESVHCTHGRKERNGVRKRGRRKKKDQQRREAPCARSSCPNKNGETEFVEEEVRKICSFPPINWRDQRGRQIGTGPTQRATRVKKD